MQFGSVGRSNGVEAIVDQILAIEKTRDKLFNLKSNLKQLSSEKKQKLDEMLVHLSEENMVFCFDPIASWILHIK